MLLVAMIFAGLAVLIYRVVGVNPLNSALATLEYSTNSGGLWTAFGTEVVDGVPGAQSNKVIERRLLGVTRVQKYVARVNYGDGTVTLEYSSATYTTVLGWRDNKTNVWLRETSPDTGGANGSRQVLKGYVSDLTPPPAKGDDDTQTFSFKLATDDYAFTAAA